PAGERPEAGMKGENQIDREAAHPVEIRSIAQLAPPDRHDRGAYFAYIRDRGRAERPDPLRLARARAREVSHRLPARARWTSCDRRARGDPVSRRLRVGSRRLPGRRRLLRALRLSHHESAVGGVPPARVDRAGRVLGPPAAKAVTRTAGRPP